MPASSASIEYGKRGIRINSIHLGYVLTPLIAQWTDTELKSALEGMHPVGRLGSSPAFADFPENVHCRGWVSG